MKTKISIKGYLVILVVIGIVSLILLVTDNEVITRDNLIRQAKQLTDGQAVSIIIALSFILGLAISHALDNITEKFVKYRISKRGEQL